MPRQIPEKKHIISRGDSLSLIYRSIEAAKKSVSCRISPGISKKHFTKIFVGLNAKDKSKC